ncbi:MAG: hypothetical protein H0X45_14050 [Planctomycetes bacterium]|nr:hypothetical protein [Planctomycetota bacterium]
MPRYVISFDDGAMDAIAMEDLAAVGQAAHAVVEKAKLAGVWITGGGVQGHEASVVACDGSITRKIVPTGIGEHLGGFVVLDVGSHDDALAWAAKFASACRCAQEVWLLMDDPDA